MTEESPQKKQRTLETNKMQEIFRIIVSAPCSFKNMCDVIGMPGPQHKANVSQNFIDEPLSDSTQQTILEIDHLDVELYNYACVKRHERLITRNE